MKILPVFFIIGLGCLTAVSAQSGRRVAHPAPVPTSTPQVQTTQGAADIEAQNAVGYSESAPNAPRSIYASPKMRKDKKSKKDKESVKPANAPPAAATTDENGEDVLKVETNLITIPISVF